MTAPTPTSPGVVDVFGLLTDPAARLDPYPVYTRLLAEHPVADAGPGLRFVSGYDDCLALLRDRRVSVDERTLGGPSPDSFPTLIHLDPPDHTRLRRLVAAAFTPRRVEALRARAVELVDAALAPLGPCDELDLIAEVAYPVPLAIIGDLLGVAPGDRALVRDCSTWMARSIDPGVLRSPELNARIDEAEAVFVAFVRSLVAERRRQPGDDLLSELVTAEADGERLAEDELIGLAVLLLVAGHETTVSLVGNGMLALLRHPAQFAAARAIASGGDAAAQRRAVDELVRFDGPAQMTSRIVLEDLELPSGGTLPAGSFAVAVLGATGRDPAAFADPGRLDVGAERAPHLGFGFGIHHCLGAALARAEGEVMIGALVRRFPGMALLDPEPPVRPTFVLRGRESLRVRL